MEHRGKKFLGSGECTIIFNIYNYIRKTHPEKCDNDMKETGVATGTSWVTTYRIRIKPTKNH